MIEMTSTSAHSENSPPKTRAMHSVLRQIPYNLFAVGVGGSEEENNAFLASWVTQCSFEPPMIAIGIRLDSASFPMLRKDAVFSLNLLGKDQADLARKLVKSKHRVGDKLSEISHTEEVTGAPLLEGCLGFVECRLVTLVKTGDHAIAIGEVVNAEQRSKDVPLSSADIGWRYGG